MPWAATTYDYVAGQWTLTGARELCADPPAWNQESQSRIMIFAPGDALTKEVDDDLGEAGNGDGGAGFGHPMDDQRKTVMKSPVMEENFQMMTRTSMTLLQKQGTQPSILQKKVPQCLVFSCRLTGITPQFKRTPKDTSPMKVLLVLSNCPMM